MKKIITIFVIAFGITSLTSCEKVIGEGSVVTEVRSVSGFSGVSISLGGYVTYKIDPVYKIEIHAQQNILDIIQTHKIGDDLIVKIQDGKRIRDHEDIFITISAPYLSHVNLSGSAEFDVANPLSTSDLKLRISGSGNITIPDVAISHELEAKISGSGNIYVLGGTIKNEDLKISGSGSMDMSNAIAENANTVISGSGDMKVHLTNTLDATISGSGSVYYKGNPLISTHISGSGKIKPI